MTLKKKLVHSLPVSLPTEARLTRSCRSPRTRRQFRYFRNVEKFCLKKVNKKKWIPLYRRRDRRVSESKEKQQSSLAGSKYGGTRGNCTRSIKVRNKLRGRSENEIEREQRESKRKLSEVLGEPLNFEFLNNIRAFFNSICAYARSSFAWSSKVRIRM